MRNNENINFRNNRLINEYTLLHHRELFYEKLTTKYLLHHLPIITYLSLSTYQNLPIIIYLSLPTYHYLFHHLPIIIYIS